jgi:hypothetical protein
LPEGIGDAAGVARGGVALPAGTDPPPAAAQAVMLNVKQTSARNLLM